MVLGAPLAAGQEQQRAAANQVWLACTSVWGRLRLDPVSFGQMVQSLRSVLSPDQAALLLTAPSVIHHLAQWPSVAAAAAAAAAAAPAAMVAMDEEEDEEDDEEDEENEEAAAAVMVLATDAVEEE